MERLPRLTFCFKGMIVVGLLLATLLLAQSLLAYFHLSEMMVSDLIKKEAERQTNILEREFQRLGSKDPDRWQAILTESRQDSSRKISWLQIIDSSGKTLVAAGKRETYSLKEEYIRAALEKRIWLSDKIYSPSGTVILALLPIHIRNNRPTPPSPNGFLSGIPTPPAPPTSLPTPANIAAMPGRNLIEVAIYLNSISDAFTPLRQNLIVGCLAAIGLAASMTLLWFQFPRYLRGRHLEEQLELAKLVQSDLLPSGDSTPKNLDFAASCLAAWQVGGDFYDVLGTERGRIAFALGDVSGKGIPAALLMGLLQGVVRSTGWLNTNVEHIRATKHLNDLLRQRTSTNRFVSLFWGFYDPETLLLRYVNAGHLPPALIRHSGNRQEIIRLDKGGPILGVLPDAQYRQGEVHLQPGDLLVMYSDGIVEASNKAEEEFGEERLWNVLRKNGDRPTADIREKVLEQVQAFLGSRQPQDDMTLVIIRIQESVRLGNTKETEPTGALSAVA